MNGGKRKFGNNNECSAVESGQGFQAEPCKGSFLRKGGGSSVGRYEHVNQNEPKKTYPYGIHSYSYDLLLHFLAGRSKAFSWNSGWHSCAWNTTIGSAAATAADPSVAASSTCTCKTFSKESSMTINSPSSIRTASSPILSSKEWP